MLNRTIATGVWVLFTVFIILFNKRENEMNIKYILSILLLGVILWVSTI